MKHSQLLAAPLLALSLITVSFANAETLDFDFTAAQFESGDTLSFTSGGYTLTATPQVNGAAARIAKAPNTGLGISLPAINDDPATTGVDESVPANWPIELGDSVTLALTTTATGTAVPFSNVRFELPTSGGAFFGQTEKADLTIAGETFPVTGEQQGTTDYLIEAPANVSQGGSDWSAATASSIVATILEV